MGIHQSIQKEVVVVAAVVEDQISIIKKIDLDLDFF